VVAEVVGPAARPLTRGRLAAVLLTSAPLAARLAWWWWLRGRERRLGVLTTSRPLVVGMERTEVEMVRRSLGRWRLRVVSTRWLAPDASPGAPRGSTSRRSTWLAPAIRLSGLALDAKPRLSTSPEPRLPELPDRARS